MTAFEELMQEVANPGSVKVPPLRVVDGGQVPPCDPPHETRDRAPEPEADIPMPDAPEDSNAAREAPPPGGPDDAAPGDDQPNAPREPSYRFTQIDNARRFVEANHRHMRYIEKRKTWKRYDGTRWPDVGIGVAIEAAKEISEQLFAEAGDARIKAEDVAVQHADILAAARDTSDRTSEGVRKRNAAKASAEHQEWADAEEEARARMAWAKESSYEAALKAMVGLASSDPRIAAEDDDFDVDPLTFNCQNGTVDLRTGDLRPHSPEDMLTRIAASNYKRDAAAPLWQEFLAKIMPDERMREWLQRFAGYCLTGLIAEQMLAFFLGIGGNGKNVYTDTMLRLMGDYATVAAPDLLVLKKHDEHPTGFADLTGRRFVVVSEIDHGRAWAEAHIKRLTGDAMIKARFMHKDFVTYRNTIKFAIMANSRPEVRGTDRGIWRRMRVVPFDAVIEKENKDLLDQLTDEFTGILAWAVAGCADWRKNGLPSPEKIARATAKYQTDQDLIGNWVAERCWCTCAPNTERTLDTEVVGLCKTCGSAIAPDSEKSHHTVERLPREWSGQPWEWQNHLQADVSQWCQERNFKPWGWNSVRAELEKRTIGPAKRRRFNVDYRTAESRGVAGLWLRELIVLPGCRCETCKQAEIMADMARQTRRGSGR